MLAVFTILCAANLSGQSLPEAYYDFVRKAESLFDAKYFLLAAQKYSKAFEVGGWKGTQDDRYNAALAWALAGNADSAFFQLDRIVQKTNYSNYERISTDNNLSLLYADARWLPLLGLVKQNKSKAEANLNKPLAHFLDSIQTEDQKYRLQISEVEQKYGHNSQEMKDLWKTIRQTDSLNLLEVTSILDKYGWLSADVVGANGNQTLFLVIQHSNQVTQEKYLPMMREAVKNGNAQSSSLALLEDRVALAQGKKQIYGSQIARDSVTQEFYVRPLEDPDNVDKRRASVGLQPLSEYLQHWNLSWDVDQYKMEIVKREQKNKIK